MSLISPAFPQASASKYPRTPAGRCASAMILIGIGLALSAHASDDCAALYNASIKTLHTPHHVYSTKTPANGAKALTGESIYAAGVEYVRIDGNWKRSLMTPQHMIDAAQEKLKTHPDVCSATGAETVDGQAVTTYKVHNNESGTDSQVRVLTSSGLLLGQTLAMPGNTHMDMRYDYINVQPPAGVN